MDKCTWTYYLILYCIYLHVHLFTLVKTVSFHGQQGGKMRHEPDGRAQKSRLLKVHHPLQSALQLQFALSSRRSSSLAVPIAFSRHITHLVISYQAPRHIEKVSCPYICIFNTLALQWFPYIPPARSLALPTSVFPFIVGMWESGFSCLNSLFQCVNIL